MSSWGHRWPYADESMTATHSARAPAAGTRLRELAGPHLPAAIPGILVVALMLVWAGDNGGYDAGTWYWGALALLSLSAVTVAALGVHRMQLTRASAIAVTAFGAYVAWSYLSIAWAQAPGTALEGSNRALLYLLAFTLMASLPWTVQGAILALSLFAVGIGTIAIVILLRLASADHLATLVVDGRLSPPTGYFNATAALFTIGALVSIALAARRELPGVLRGILIAMATAELQLAVVGQSRGWLFTLPLVALATLAIARDRLRLVAAAALPVLATLIPVHTLIGVFNSEDPAALARAAKHAGKVSLALCAATLVIGTLAAWAETLLRPRPLSLRARRLVGGSLAVIGIVAVIAGGTAATHGDPFGFVKRQWQGFSHVPTADASGSHFATVGSGRYDFWRVALDALVAHPIGGLGQDNFADYYLPRRHTNEEPAWTHSLEMRLLAHTGLVGFVVFAAFLVTAIAGAMRVRRRAPVAAQWVAAAALAPLTGWVFHGSVDWFWEMPALSGPAVGFLGLSLALGKLGGQSATLGKLGGESATRSGAGGSPAATTAPRRAPRSIIGAGAVVALVVAAVVLGFPYLSVREQSAATAVRDRNPDAALRDLADASRLNPLSADPGRTAGALALQIGNYPEAESRFSQSISRERDGWFAWLGRGLAASALGNAAQARRDYQMAASINSRQEVIKQALTRVDSTRPLTPAQAFRMLTLIH
jgi:hypothetical protein